jgi:hypothetical protein
MRQRPAQEKPVDAPQEEEIEYIAKGGTTPRPGDDGAGLEHDSGWRPNVADAG